MGDQNGLTAKVTLLYYFNVCIRYDVKSLDDVLYQFGLSISFVPQRLSLVSTSEMRRTVNTYNFIPTRYCKQEQKYICTKYLETLHELQCILSNVCRSVGHDQEFDIECLPTELHPETLFQPQGSESIRLALCSYIGITETMISHTTEHSTIMTSTVFYCFHNIFPLFLASRCLSKILEK